MTTTASSERFQAEAEKYARYLETPEGRLRLDLSFANVEEFLPRIGVGRGLCALDVGCGTGVLAVRLARVGFHVTLLDSSAAMLEIAKRAASNAGVAQNIAVKHGDATKIAAMFGEECFDLILCHNVLEYVEDPSAVLRGAPRALRNSSAILSLLVRNRAGEVLKAAIKAGDLAAAEQNLTAESAQESLYGGNVRLFTPSGLASLFRESSLEIIAERGVRVVSDYLPPQVSRTAAYDDIFKLERNLGRRPGFAAVARHTQCLARRADVIIGDSA